MMLSPQIKRSGSLPHRLISLPLCWSIDVSWCSARIARTPAAGSKLELTAMTLQSPRKPMVYELQLPSRSKFPLAPLYPAGKVKQSAVGRVTVAYDASYAFALKIICLFCRI